MKNCRSSRTPDSRRSMSPVRRVVKYDIGSDEQLGGQEVEALGVDPHRDEGEEVALEDRGADHHDQDAEHPEQDDDEQLLVLVRDRVVDDDLREDRQDELERGRDQRQADRLPQEAAVRAQERLEPGGVRLRLGQLLEGRASG